MVRNLSLFIFIFVLFVLQMSVFGEFFGPQSIPNVILAFVASLAVRKGIEGNIGWIVLAGILFDAGTDRLIGSSALIFVVLAFGIDKMNAISNIQSRRMLFYPSFAVVMAVSLVLFDWAGIGLAGAEKYFFSGGVESAAPLHLNADYFQKTFFTVVSGYAAYYFLKKTQANDSRKLFQQKAAH